MPFWTIVRLRSPLAAPVGTTKLIWYSPTRLGVRPANWTTERTLSTETVTGLLAEARELEGEGAPVATAVLVAPRPEA